MSHSRRISAIAGAAALLLTATACSGLGRSTVGMLRFEGHTRGHDVPVEVSYSNTPVQGCHRIAIPAGATHVENNTLVDIILYRTENCEHPDQADGIYVATTLSNVTAPRSLPWRSFSVVH
uniref:Lipoprotein n=1 Tax=Streptomyces sp. NBC_00049 TaxID=2903617 RepID=A0AAU2JZM1_9ACTN